MEIIYTEKGVSKGRISVARTLATMGKGEQWTASVQDVDPFYVRTACWKLARLTHKEFSVTHTAETGDSIIITRLS